MKDIKRYVVTMDFYVFAETDEEAVSIAKKFANKQDQKKDNKARVVGIDELPFGAKESRKLNYWI